MAKLIPAEKAQDNVRKYHENKYILEELSAYYEDNLVPIINDLIKESSLKGCSGIEMTFHLPERFRGFTFNPLDWIQKQIEEAGYDVTTNIEDNLHNTVKLSINWQSKFEF